MYRMGRQIVVFLFMITRVFSAWVQNFSIEQANISALLSAIAYCGKKEYVNHAFHGPLAGFLVNDVIYDPKSDLQGFIGTLPSTQDIYIVFRGSSSVRNWIEDLDIQMTDYYTFQYCNCKIHTGFYGSMLRVFPQIYETIMNIRLEHRQIIVTGHSYGAAIAQLTAMQLSAFHIPSTVYNFGQPRIGDTFYARLVNLQIKNMWRIVHDRDIVPHLPPTRGLDYVHSCGEVFEDAYGVLYSCSDVDCGDNYCSHRYNLRETTVKDHGVYLGHEMKCTAESEILKFQY